MKDCFRLNMFWWVVETRNTYKIVGAEDLFMIADIDISG
jgi:hypothetical protein